MQCLLSPSQESSYFCNRRHLSDSCCILHKDFDPEADKWVPVSMLGILWQPLPVENGMTSWISTSEIASFEKFVLEHFSETHEYRGICWSQECMLIHMGMLKKHTPSMPIAVPAYGWRMVEREWKRKQRWRRSLVFPGKEEQLLRRRWWENTPEQRKEAQLMGRWELAKGVEYRKEPGELLLWWSKIRKKNLEIRETVRNRWKPPECTFQSGSQCHVLIWRNEILKTWCRHLVHQKDSIYPKGSFCQFCKRNFDKMIGCLWKQW